jgi:hypothetical protein
MRWWCCILAAGGCQEYVLDSKDAVETDFTTPTTSTTPTTVDTIPETTPVESADTGTPPSCDGVDLAWSWLASAPFPHEPDPTDASGLPFYDVDFAALGWSAVSSPDRAIPAGSDRVYRTILDLPQMPPQLIVSLQSDDGIWLWVNGLEVVHYGGDWQEEGCVNENADCLVTEQVPELDLTPFLSPGSNLIAARVSNAIENGYFELIPTCVD